LIQINLAVSSDTLGKIVQRNKILNLLQTIVGVDFNLIQSFGTQKEGNHLKDYLETQRSIYNKKPFAGFRELIFTYVQIGH
jgi:hypothetical protein